MIEFWAATLSIGASTLRVSTPLVFAALGGLISERAGVINIALEGMMLIGAFAAGAVAPTVGSAAWGAVAGGCAGMAMAALYGLFVIRLRSDQIVAGTAINLLALGSTPFLAKILFGSTTSTPSLPLELRLGSAPLWIAGALGLVVWAGLARLPAGLWLRFAGEHPVALEAAGIGVNRVRWTAVLMSGFLAGLGGASLSIFLASSFSRNMTGGRGFMAIAAMIFGKWKPLPTMAACLLFGFTDAVQIRLQGVTLWGSEPVPVQFIQVLPYLVTVGVLAGFMGKSRAPKALGLPFKRA